MNKKLKTFFTSFSVLRIICIVLIFVLDDVSMYDVNEREGKGLNIDLTFEWWQYALGYTILFAFAFNTITSLFLSFKPLPLLRGFMNRSGLLVVFYVVELLILPFFIYTSFEEIKDRFFPSRTFVDDLLGTFFPPNQRSEVFERTEAVNFVVLCICSFIFLVFFWQVYRQRKDSFRPIELRGS